MIRLSRFGISLKPALTAWGGYFLFAAATRSLDALPFSTEIWSYAQRLRSFGGWFEHFLFVVALGFTLQFVWKRNEVGKQLKVARGQLCSNCGYPFASSSTAAFRCTECGAALHPTQVAAAAKSVGLSTCNESARLAVGIMPVHAPRSGEPPTGA